MKTINTYQEAIFEPMLERMLAPENLHREPQLSLFQKVLLTTDGSVTELLRLYAGGPIRASKLFQTVGTGPLADASGLLEALDAPAGASLLQREIMLIHGTTPLVFAASTFVLARLSPAIRAGLVDTEVPIGLLWRQERAEMYREIVDLRLERFAAVAAHFGLAADTLLLSRSYTLRQSGRVMGMITEKFPITGFR
ncbi:chorismate--pyruvate lyase family protein [Variovorax sp. HJSM1_2]|uniref:chorismate--pyruvate lyase family protein n=1 Tax=Variovorax sp. HJSM1_2 TaxID=3366263 RepID=UPI003BC44614